MDAKSGGGRSMKKELEPHPIQLDEVQAEKLVKDRMKTMDPAKVDFSEDFMNQLHDKIMAKVEQTEIQPKLATEKLPFKLRLWWSKSASKSTSYVLTALVVVMAGIGASKPMTSLRTTPVAQASAQGDAFVQEALKSPEAFEEMIAGSLGQNDFLVDVASRNFDHLNLNDFDTLFGTSTVGLSHGASSRLEETQ